MDEYTPISQKELERGYFFVTHKNQITKIVYGVAIVILAILYISLIWRVVTYLQSGSFEQQAANLQNSSFDWAAYHQKRGPIDLDVGEPQYVSIGDRKYNLAVPITNHNTDWALKKLTYSFVVNGEKLPEDTTFVNPDENSYLIDFAQEIPKGITSVSIDIIGQDWQRIGPDFYDINFEISNIKFQPASRMEVGRDTIDVPARVAWQAENMTLDSFWDIAWQVVLYNGSKIVGVNYLMTHDFASLEKRDLEVVWLDNLPRVTKVEVLPVINKLDSGNIKDIYADTPSGNLLNL